MSTAESRLDVQKYAIYSDLITSPESHAYPTSLTGNFWYTTSLRSKNIIDPSLIPSQLPPQCKLNAGQAMTLLVARIARTRWSPLLLHYVPMARVTPAGMDCFTRLFTCYPRRLDEQKKPNSGDPRIDGLGRAIEDDFATVRQNYATPKNPIVLAHGLLGFDELHPAGSMLPSIQYWRGITEAMRANGIEVITASVPASGSIEERATKLGQDIAEKANGRGVNIVAHSMGGLDARYMISTLQPDNVQVLSLTTVATPHRGSSFADFCFEQIGEEHIPRVYKAWGALGFGTGAFKELTRKHMREDFNPNTPDVADVRYFSYGAVFTPSIWSAFRQPHRVVMKMEGPNDGLVSVESARWGTYKGTLVEVSHLDLINWTNRLKFLFSQIMGRERKFNAIAFYLDIADMLAKEGL